MTPRDRFDTPLAGRSGEARAAETVEERPAIAQMVESRLLPPRALEQRSLIHAAMRNPRQMDLVRELRTNILTKSVTRNPVLMVTGVASGCGTSYLARNLAASIALDEEHTALLIECNHRRPGLARDFRLPENSPGLLDMFRPDFDDLAAIIYPSGVERLRLIPSGRCARRGPEYYASMRMRGLINELRGRYDDRHIVLDAPPVLGSPDARILAEHADLVILVAGEGRHRPETIRRAAEALPADRFAGVAFNHLP